jgi:hypothetical protein
VENGGLTTEPSFLGLFDLSIWSRRRKHMLMRVVRWSGVEWSLLLGISVCGCYIEILICWSSFEGWHGSCFYGGYVSIG